MTREEHIKQAIQDMLAELTRAEHIHPVWPGVGHAGDHVRAAGKLVEESGEAFKEANNIDEGKGTIFHLRKELVQAGAMALRNIINLDAVERQRINESSRQDLQEEHNVYTDGPIFTNGGGFAYAPKAERLVLSDFAEGSGVE